MAPVRSVLFVCTGNTCRSPLAEGLLRHALGEGGSVRVGSAGIAAHEGAPASAHTVALLKEIGVDLSDHRARQLDEDLLDESDLVLCLSRHHRDAIVDHRPDAADKVGLVLDYVDGLEGHDVADPVGGPRAAYVEVRDLIVEALPGLLAALKGDTGPRA